MKFAQTNNMMMAMMMYMPGCMCMFVVLENTTRLVFASNNG